uniref:Ubiquitin-like domain-containing protein n=1 Tax=Knipowitschia caucasica TaxID=637954 RepID=A0AAV2J3B7_KNICA
MAQYPDPWAPWVTVDHEYLGPKSFQASRGTSVLEVKQLVYEETDLPVPEQRLVHRGRVADVENAEYDACVQLYLRSVCFLDWPSLQRL